MKRIYTLFTFLLLTQVNLFAQEVIDEKVVIQQTLSNNFEILLSENSTAIDRNNISLGNAGMLPTLDVVGDYSKNNNVRFEGFSSQRDSTIVVDNVRSSSYGVEARLNWVLFDGTKMFVTYEKLSRISEKSQWETKTLVENKLAEALTAYYRLVNEKSKVQVLKDAVALSSERLKIAKEKYEVGTFSRTDYLSAQIDLNTDRSNLILQQSVFEEAKVRMNQIMANPAQTELSIADSTFRINKKFTIEKLRDKLNADNYALIASRIGLAIAEREKREIQTELLPQISFQAAAGLGGSQNPVGFFQTTDTRSYNYGFTASWRIFDGFNKNRRIQNAIINEENQQVSLNSLKNELLGQLETNFVYYQNRVQLIGLELENVKIAKENAALSFERFESGQANSLELREAQLNAVTAAGRLLNALFQAKIAEIEILRITGTTILIE